MRYLSSISLTLVALLALACTAEPDFGGFGDRTKPIFHIFSGMRHTAQNIIDGHLPVSHLDMEPCKDMHANVSAGVIDWGNDKGEAAFSVACDELWELYLENLYLALDEEKIDRLSEEEQQKFTSELEGIIQRFHHNIVCGVGYDFKPGEKDDSFVCVERPAGSN
jgi:hypothetical protein